MAKKKRPVRRQRDDAAASESRIVPDSAIPPAIAAPVRIPLLPGWRRAEVPQEWQSHELVRDQYFYTIPLELLRLVQTEVGQDRFDSRLWRMEQDLSEIHGDHRNSIGFGLGFPIDYQILRERTLDAEAAAHIRFISTRDPDETLRQARSQLNLANRDRRAYAGWLLTNRDFLDEHEALMTLLHSCQGPFPFPRPGPSCMSAGVQIGMLRLDASEAGVAIGQSFARFCARWRLIQLYGPLLPDPLGRHTPAPLPETSARQALASGYNIMAIPDTMPLPSESAFRAMAENIIRADGHPHLSDWFSVIRAENASRNALVRYARVFELQHYYRLLMGRHRATFHRKQAALGCALAEFLNVSQDTVQRDLRWIESRLGKTWYEEFRVHRF